MHDPNEILIRLKGRCRPGIIRSIGEKLSMQTLDSDYFIKHIPFYMHLQTVYKHFTSYGQWSKKSSYMSDFFLDHQGKNGNYAHSSSSDIIAVLFM